MTVGKYEIRISKSSDATAAGTATYNQYYEVLQGPANLPTVNEVIVNSEHDSNILESGRRRNSLFRVPKRYLCKYN